MKKLFLPIFSLLLLAYGLLQILYLLTLFDVLSFLRSREWTTFFGWANYIALISGLALFKPPASFLLSYGILRRRPWAFHGIRAGLWAMPLLLFSEFLWWGTFRLRPLPTLLFGMTFTGMVWLFSRPEVKEKFGDRPFKLMSGSGAIGALVLVLALLPLATSISVKLMFGEKVKAPQITSRVINGSLPRGLKPVRLMDCRVPVSEDGYLMNYDRFGFTGKANPWCFTFRGKSNFFLYQNHFPEEEVFSGLPDLGVTSFEKDRFFRTNDWNPLILTLRSMSRAMWPTAKDFEINVPAGKGFLTVWSRLKKNGGESFQALFSLHAPDGRRTLNGMLNLDALSELDAVISAIRFESPEDSARAETYFQEAQSIAKEGRRLDAQVAYANAYYLSPQSSEFKSSLDGTLNSGFASCPIRWKS